jgi:hypothetical protein
MGVSGLYVKVLGTPIGGMSEVDGDGDGFVSGPGGDKYPAPIKKAVDGLNEILVPASNFAEANKKNRPWAPLLRDGWTPELRKQMDDAIDFEKRLAPIAVAWLNKYGDNPNAHSVIVALFDGAHSVIGNRDDPDGKKYFEELLKNLGDDANSKESQDLLKFVRDNGVPVMARHAKVKKWSDDYVNHVIEALKQNGVKETHPFYKTMLEYKKYENSPAHYPNPIGRWLGHSLMGLEKSGKIIQFMADVKRDGAVPDADEVAKKLVENKNRRIGIAISEGGLEKVLSDGKYKNLFENNGRNAFIDAWKLERRDSQERNKLRKQMEFRAVAEQMLFGIPVAGSKKSARPVYGFFFEDGVEQIGVNGGTYGRLTMVMKRGVEERSTMTAGDSIAGQFMGVSPLNDPKGIGVQGGWAGTVNDQKPDYSSYNNRYFEAQIFGGVKIEDIAYIAVPFNYKFANKDVQKRLAELGVPIQILPREGKFVEPGDLQGKSDKRESGVLIAVSGEARLFEVDKDVGYLLVNGERIDVPSVSAVLKFGYWDLVDSGENDKKNLAVKVLGTPIGGMSEIDGDGDGFVSGPGGDKYPAPLKRQIRDLTKDLASLFGKSKDEFEKSEAGREYKQRLEKVPKGVGRDVQLEMIAEKQGFDKPPKVVSADEIERLRKEGWIIAYRGLSTAMVEGEDGKGTVIKAKQMADDFRSGQYFAGMGVHGNGINFALDRETADIYAQGFYEDGGEVLVVAIPPDALMSIEEMKKTVAEHRARIGRGETNFYGDDDISRSLAARGVKGTRLNVLVSNGWVSEVAEDSDAEPNVVVVYDRSMLAVQERSK